MVSDVLSIAASGSFLSEYGQVCFAPLLVNLWMSDVISVQPEDFDVALEYQQLRQATSTGAVVIFSGLVRDMNLGDHVGGLFLEHYPGMTEKSLQAIVDEACARWPIDNCRIIHRVGQLELGDQIVFVGVASAHRQAAFEACEFLMDYLKVQAPFWKREQTEQGERWIEARDSDDVAADRWQCQNRNQNGV